jgi:hypothetical protein
VRDVLLRIVRVRGDVAACKLNGDFAARPERQIGEIHARGLFDLPDQHLVRVLRLRSRHQHAPTLRAGGLEKRRDVPVA